VTIYSVGYGNRGFEVFLALVRSFQITHLVDVRSVPQSSYWEDFRRERLQLLLRDTEIKYVYMGDTLGGVQDSPALCKDPESVEMAPLREEPRLRLGLERLIESASHPERKICLMCGCMRPLQCHRSRLLGPELIQAGIEYLHIDSDGSVKSQVQVEAEATPQASLF
jgi:uncharacterized protein (DUF488 family)